MTGRPGDWSEPGEYNILFLGSVLVISSQDSCALGYREFTQEGAMTISLFAAREGTSAPQWPIVKKCCRHLVPSSDFFVQSSAVPIFGPSPEETTCSFPYRFSGENRNSGLAPGNRNPKAMARKIKQKAAAVRARFRSETGRIRVQRALLQTPSFALTEFWAESSVSASQPIICVPKRTHRVVRRTHQVCRKLS